MSDTAASLIERAHALLDLRRGQDAERHLRPALASDPDNATLQVLLARALLIQERYAEARDAARAGLASAPDDITAHAVLSAALSGTDDHAEALTVVRAGLRLAPNSSGLHHQEAAVLLQLDRPREALDSVGRARAIDPLDSDAAALQAAALYELKDLAGAEAAVRDALRLDPENPTAHRVEGVLALRRGGGTRAVDAHRNALRLDPTDSSAREGLAISMKTRNPLYGALVRYGAWFSGLPTGVKVLLALGPYLLTRVLGPFRDEPWAIALIVVILAVVLLSWMLEPLMNLVLLCDRTGRVLLDGPAKLATYAFSGFVLAAVACAVLASTSGPRGLLTYTAAFGVWALPAGMAHTVRPGLRKPAAVTVGVVALTAVAGAVALVAGAPVAPLGIVLVIAGLVALWVVAFA